MAGPVEPAPRRRRGLSPVHVLWRLLPAAGRRRTLSRVATWLAPRPDEVPPPPPDASVAIGGEFSRASGLGEGARLLSAACTGLGVACREVELAIGRRVRGQRPAPGVPLILPINPAQVAASLVRVERGLLRDRRVVGYFPCELPSLPPAWRHARRYVHEVWAPSRFSAAAFAAAGFGDVRVVPYPLAVAPPCPSALTRRDFGWPEDAVVVLVSFSLASSFERKNPLAAIEAFRRAFGGRRDRRLVLKVGHIADHAGDVVRLRRAIGEAPNIVLETRMLSRADSHAMTGAADIVLSLHRSEGFGLVPAEAMLLARAVVATDWSGTTDFLDAGCAVPVPYRLVEARDPRGVFEAPGAVWAQADVEAAADALVQLAEDAGWRRTLGDAARDRARRRFGVGALLDALGGIGIIPPMGASG